MSRSTRTHRGSVHHAMLCAGAVMLAPAAAAADCPDWYAAPGQPGLSGTGGAGQYVSSFAVFDDGGGEALYAAGGFTIPANRVAKWDGQNWQSVGFNLASSGWINTMTVFDGALYVGASNDINGRIARYDGSTWDIPGGGVTSGGGNLVSSLAVFDDGSGPALFVGGRFDMAGNTPVTNIAKWDGQNWHDVGGGIDGSFSPSVMDMVVFDDGSGPALYASGRFDTAGGQPSPSIAKWDGQQWSPVGGGLSSSGVSAMAVFDDGSGPALYLAGNTMSGAGLPTTRIARWDGQNWSIPGGISVDGYARGVAVFDDGDGEALYVMGGFDGVGAISSKFIARWDGQEWSSVDGGLTGGNSALVAFPYDDGSGLSLFIGGSFSSTVSGVPASMVAAWRACEDVCPPDWNGDGVVDSDDLFDFLADWAAGNADYNGDGVTDSDDLFDFLTDWAAGC